MDPKSPINTRIALCVYKLKKAQISNIQFEKDLKIKWKIDVYLYLLIIWNNASFESK